MCMMLTLHVVNLNYVHILSQFAMGKSKPSALREEAGDISESDNVKRKLPESPYSYKFSRDIIFKDD